jgi:hypothetical protein
MDLTRQLLGVHHALDLWRHVPSESGFLRGYPSWVPFHACLLYGIIRLLRDRDPPGIVHLARQILRIHHALDPRRLVPSDPVFSGRCSPWVPFHASLLVTGSIPLPGNAKLPGVVDLARQLLGVHHALNVRSTL